MIKYHDKVQFSLNALRSVLKQDGLGVFQSGLTDSIQNIKSEEIVNALISEIENFLTEESSCEIDQVSGRIETKFAKLGAEGVSITDESLEKITSGILNYLPDIQNIDSLDKTEQEDGLSAKAGNSKVSLIQKIFEKLKWNKKPEKTDVVESIIYILNNINKDEKLKDFKEYLNELSKEAKKNASDEWTPARIENILQHSNFFKWYFDSLVNVPNYLTWMYGSRLEQKLDNPFLLKLGEQLMKISEKTALFSLDMNYVVFKFTENNIFRAENDLALKASEMILKAAEFNVFVSDKILSISNILLSTMSVAYLTSQTTSLVGVMVSVTTSMISILTLTLTTMGSFMTSVFSLVATIANSVLSAALSASISILSALLSLSVSILIYLVPFFAIAGALVMAAMLEMGLMSIILFTELTLMEIATLTTYATIMIIFGLYAFSMLASGGIFGTFLTLIVIPAVLLAALLIMSFSVFFMLAVSSVVALFISAIVLELAIITVGIAIPIAVMLAAAAVSVVILLAVAAGIGLIAMVLILFALSLFAGDKDFIDNILDFLKGTAIYEWYLKEVKSRGGIGGYLEYQVSVVLKKIEDFKQGLIDAVTNYFHDTWFYKWWTEEVEPAGGLWSWIKYQITSVLDWVSHPEMIWENLKRKIADMWSWLQEFGKTILSGINDWWQNSTIKSVLDSIYNYTVKIGEKLKNAAEVSTDFVKGVLRGGGPDPAAEEARMKEANENSKQQWVIARSSMDEFIQKNKSNLEAYKNFLAQQIPRYQQLQKLYANDPSWTTTLDITRWRCNAMAMMATKISNDRYQEQIKKSKSIEQLKKNLEFYKSEQQKMYDPNDVRREFTEQNISLLENRISELEMQKQKDESDIDSKSKDASNKNMEQNKNREDKLNGQDAKLNNMASSGTENNAEPELVPYPIQNPHHILTGKADLNAL